MMLSYLKSLAYHLLMPVILLSFGVTSGQNAPATPAVLMGVVTNGASGLPVIGAKVTVNGLVTWSASGGIYSLTIDPVGVFSVACSKSGFDNFKIGRAHV